jgi:hypothetical protein
MIKRKKAEGKLNMIQAAERERTSVSEENKEEEQAGWQRIADERARSWKKRKKNEKSTEEKR